MRNKSNPSYYYKWNLLSPISFIQKNAAENSLAFESTGTVRISFWTPSTCAIFFNSSSRGMRPQHFFGHQAAIYRHT